MKKKSIISCLLFALMVMPIYAGDDPSIKGKLRVNIQKSMKKHIQSNVLKNKYIIFDAKTNKLLRLKLVSLHKGIVKKDKFFVSCADFIDNKNNKYDLDFLVIKNKGQFIVAQALIHSINKKKRPYHLEE